MSEVAAARDPLKVVNGNAPASRLKPPTKVVKEDFAEENEEMDQENTSMSSTLKRKKTEAELRESLRQRKLMNSTMSASELRSATARSKVDLNATLDAGSAAKVRKVTTSTTLSRTSNLSKPTASAAAKLKSTTTAAAKTTTKSTTTASAAATGLDGVPKRAAWDIKGRLEDTERLLNMMRNELKKNGQQLDTVNAQLSEKETVITTIKEVKGTLESDVDSSRRELQQVLTEKLDLQNQLISMQQEHNMRVQSLMLKYQTLETTHSGTVGSLNLAKAENESLKMTVEGQTSQMASMQSEINSIKIQLKSAQDSASEKQRKIEDLLITLDQKNQTIEELEAQIREDETIRKKLHNTIQELKGNIRVFCRIRPFLGAEIEDNGSDIPAHFEIPNNSDKSIDINTTQLSGITGKADGKKYQFTFDKVFGPKSTQSRVFDEISQLVQSSLDGYNTCIFAYGQTGSGKTYTMEGPGIQSEIDMPIVDREGRGMIPRAVEQIFETAESLKDKGWSYEMEAMYIEIYNETIRDLLSKKKSSDDDKPLDIKHDAKGNTSVSNVTLVKVRSPTQVYELLARASHNRSVGRTDMNERSSRSHSVFQLKLSGTNKITTESVNGLLNLIDLAGSERLNQSGAVGQRLKETLHINKSLAHLGDVIAALANKEAHIPYRNSKLTYLLQNSLGGNSKTLMFVNISPRGSDLNETISSLRFATKVNACEIGTAKKQTKADLSK